MQEVLEDAFKILLNASVPLVAAGRTDAGVHAREMMAHADFDPPEDIPHFIYRLNALLPPDIAVRELLEVNEKAHARFDATERRYEYWIVKEKDPFFMDTAFYVPGDLDLDAMNSAASLLREYKDFRCFSRSNSDVKTFLCDLRQAEWSRQGHHWVFSITADRFLRNMVRAIVGTLLEVGQGKLGQEDVKAILKSRDRSRAGVSVPAKGLYLTQVSYPADIFKPGT